MNIHDCLNMLGYIGFFVIDALNLIPTKSLEKHAKQRCAVVGALSDETVLSEWCKLEWHSRFGNRSETIAPNVHDSLDNFGYMDSSALLHST